MADEVTEVTHESWFSRLSGAFKGMIFGLILFLIAFPVLFWNEGRAVKRAQGLSEGAAAVVSVDPDRVLDENDGRLVHLTGEATTEETLRDPQFAIAEEAIHLYRDVEMFQWVEDVQKEKRNKTGGGTETVTTYRYNTQWSSQLIDSSKFNESAGHQNPSSMPYSPWSESADDVTIGDYELPDELIGKISGSTRIDASEEMLSRLPDDMKSRFRVHDNTLFMGNDPAAPQVGDMRISFAGVYPKTVSLVAKQIGDTFEPYRAESGTSIMLLEMGEHSADDMFASAVTANNRMTWILRLVGFAMMLIGLLMLLSPLKVLADVFPPLGSLVGSGTFVVSLLIAAPLTLTTMAVGWIVYRPLLGILLLAGAVILLVGLGISMLRGKKKVEAEKKDPAPSLSEEL